MQNLIEKNARVIFAKGLNCLHIHLSGFLTYDELVRVLQYEFRMVQYYKLKKCIVDLRQMKVYPSGGKEYIKEVWFPQMESIGMKCIAFIVPENVFGEASMQKAHEGVETNKKILTRNFREETSALAWLREAKITHETLA